MDRVLIKEFIRVNEKEYTLFVIDVDSEQITLGTSNELTDYEDDFMTVFSNSNSIDKAKELKVFLESIVSEDTTVWINTL